MSKEREDRLERLVKWFARGWTYESPETGQLVQNEPYFAPYDPIGQVELPENVELLATWREVMGGVPVESVVATRVVGRERSAGQPGE